MNVVAKRKGYGELLRRAVGGMLPKNKLLKIRLETLKVFDGEENPYNNNTLHLPVNSQGFLRS